MKPTPRSSEEEGQRNMTDVKTPDSSPKREALLTSEETSSHIPIRPLYTPADLAAWEWNYDRDAGYPGGFPYPAAAQPPRYPAPLWTIRRNDGMASPGGA